MGRIFESEVGTMAVQEILAGMPWWVKWVAIPALVLVVFGGLITSVLTFVVALLFKVLLFVALVAGLVYVVRKFKGSTGSREDW
ncbi:putative membrane spanning protein [Streptomyces venezuelae]|nr:putative membrane spanning protein [Streptomyces venezuelae]